jgi:hypothetical protein
MGRWLHVGANKKELFSLLQRIRLSQGREKEERRYNWMKAQEEALFMERTSVLKKGTACLTETLT